MTTETITKSAFKVGSVYSAPSACDRNAVWTFKVVARTAKFVTLQRPSQPDIVTRVGVKIDELGEWALPFGTYSMAPVIRADRAA